MAIRGVLLVVVSLLFAGKASAQFADFHGKVDPKWTGPTFKLSQNFPTALPNAGDSCVYRKPYPDFSRNRIS